MATLVAGYDGSDGSKAALRTAVSTAKAFGDRIVAAFGAGVYPIGEDADLQRLVHDMGRNWTEEALAAVRAQGFTECEAVIVDLRPAEALLRVAEERNARMIVVGTQGSTR